VNTRFEDYGPAYLWQLEAQGTRVAAILNAIATAPSGGMVVHCGVGKDRTGVIVALLLAVAGVGREAIAADYALSGPRLAALARRELAKEADPTRRHRLRAMWEAEPGLITGLLDDLERRHGAVAGYLRDVGVDERAQERLRRRLVPM
jgi:protein-tyrosine phosphatase